MNNSKPYASSCTVKQIAIWKAGAEQEKPYANLIGMVTHMQYHEDIFHPAYSATLVVVDNQESLISSMPIQGYEKVVVEVEDTNSERYSYEFRVWKVANRTSSERTQIYTLCLISVEGLLNEGMRVNTIQTGTPTEIVSRLLNQKLGVSPSQIFAQPSEGRIKYLPIKKSPFSVIRTLQSKSVAINDPVKKTISNTTLSNSATYSGVSDVGSGAQKAKGTAGFLFFQNRKGFVFKSIDELCSIKNIPVIGDEFTWSPGKTNYESRNKIQEIVYGSEIDIMKKMREGTFSSIVCYMDINTGKYEEFVYSLEDTWKDMTHLGSQTDLPVGQSTLSEFPSRVMSTIVNHECWYSGSGVASEDSEYIDNQKRYLSQGLSRLGLIFNQQLTISLTGHLELSAGDKIEIRVPNQTVESQRFKEVWDPEHSGTYLIKHLNHQIDVLDENMYTVLELVRDSYGIKNKESKVITK
tara:strand:- start:79 stop:1476 length:1398 start_codon:yes stop_codon:yes gene_type:complete